MENKNKDEKELREELLKIYTPLDVAKKEIWKRWKDKELRKKVENFLGGKIPKALKKGPKAVLARQVASPNHEFLKYLELARLSGLKPKCLEYIHDKFRTENQDKYYLGKLIFFNGTGKNGGHKTDVVKLINYNDSEGKKLTKIKTLQGENLVDFHHKLITKCVNDCKIKDIISDESRWVAQNGGTPEIFYEKFLALFICFGVLFENYLVSEKKFAKRILFPGLKEMKEKFGVSPLIVKLFPVGRDDELYWQYYPKSSQEKIK